jgi:hypothetical protein
MESMHFLWCNVIIIGIIQHTLSLPTIMFWHATKNCQTQSWRYNPCNHKIVEAGVITHATKTLLKLALQPMQAKHCRSWRYNQQHQSNALQCS